MKVKAEAWWRCTGDSQWPGGRERKEGRTRVLAHLPLQLSLE